PGAALSEGRAFVRQSGPADLRSGGGGAGDCADRGDAQGDVRRRGEMKLATAALAMVVALGSVAQAETLKLAVGQRGTWDTSVAELGQRGGLFKKQGLDLDILYTQGGGETQQAVLSGSVDIGVAAGVMGVLGAFSKGAPVRILGNEMT